MSLSAPTLVAQARESILAGILSGRFQGRLPTEDELAELLDVSRTTIRAAVQDLERDGLLKRRRAIGTVINSHVSFNTLALQRLIGFDRLLEENGYDVRVDVTAERRAPGEVVDRLPWDDVEDCCVLDKRYYADDRMAIALRDYMPWSELRSGRLPKTIEPSLFDFSTKHCEHRIDHAVVRIVPMVNARPGTTDLALAKNEAFIRLHETHYSADAAPVAWTMIDINDELLNLDVFRSRA